MFQHIGEPIASYLHLNVSSDLKMRSNIYTNSLNQKEIFDNDIESVRELCREIDVVMTPRR